MGTYKRLFRGILLVVGIVLFVIVTVQVVSAQEVTQGYETDQQLQNGMIVQLKPGDGSKVEELTANNIGQMLGVVVPLDDSPVDLSTVGNSQQVYVATYGDQQVLVSDQNGSIKSGDPVSISSVAGVGMKAQSSQNLIIGKALESFDGKTDSEGTMTVRTATGSKLVNFGRIIVNVSVAPNPLFSGTINPQVPKFLARAAQLITMRPVSTFRIYASLTVIVLSVLIAGGILYAGVRSGMVAVGRNPLAKKSIFRNLIQVTLMALIVFAIGLFAVYLLLKV